MVQTVDSRAVRQALVAWFETQELTIAPFGEGHINHSWLVCASSGEYVLQQISREVFPDPRRIADNLKQLFEVVAGDRNFRYQLPEPLPSLDGRSLVGLQPAAAVPAGDDRAVDRAVNDSVDGSGPSYWRLCRRIANGRTLQSLVNIEQARAAGEAFGCFQRMTTALDPLALGEVIPGFHKLDGYLCSLEASIAASDVLEPSEADLVTRLLDRQQAYLSGVALTDQSTDVVIHGDCKVNNLLFAEDGDAVVAVLDLDTLMAGAWWLDFGDLVRSAAFSPHGVFRHAYYAAVAEGFFFGRGTFPDSDVEAALRAPAHVGFMLAVRFLDDHFRGDRYFRVRRHGDNLQRAKAQVEQFLQLEADENQRFMRHTLRLIQARSE